jgi:hypothetical protein
MLIEYLEEYIGSEVEILEYNSNSNMTTDYVVRFKENVPENKYDTTILLDFHAIYVYSNNTKFADLSMIMSKHHNDVISGNQYAQYITKTVYKYQNYRWIETTDTPFLYL